MKKLNDIAGIDIFDPETLEKRGSTQAGLLLVIKN